MGTALFRAGLKKRGLTELLELHVKDFPPAGAIESLLLMREVKLAESVDPGLSPDRRRGVIAEANRILEQLIQENDSDPRRFEWRFVLARSLLYDEAEPFLTSILYRGGSEADRGRLLALSTRAAETLATLLADIRAEYDHHDHLSAADFERLEADGYIEKLDRLEPRADYLLLWARFYDALPRAKMDPVRTQQLNRIVERFAANPAILDTPHQKSRVQVQALLLAGMTHRLLEHYGPARDYLDRASQVASRLADPIERKRIGWAVTLARLERIRSDADDGRFASALSQLARFRQTLAGEHGEDFGLRVVAALLERSIYRLHAETVEQMGRPGEATRLREQSWKPLSELAIREPDRRDELYATLYDMIGPDAEPDRLDPVEQCALIAGLLFDADRANDAPDPSLDRAVYVGQRFLANVSESAQSLVAEVLYNVGVAQYRRGRTLKAAARLLEVTKDHPGFGKALQAAGLAVQLGAELYGDPSRRPRPEVQRLYRDALTLLMTRYPDPDLGRYWRFYYAQLLDVLGEYEHAAAQYALVDQAHERYLESVFAHTRCLALSLQKQAVGETQDLLGLRRRINDFLAVQRRFVALATSELGRQPDDLRASTVRSLLARALLMAAEVRVLSPIHALAQTLEMLVGFEDEYPNEPALSGRVWRVRLIAYERLGRLEEAKEAIPVYIAADPKNAGTTLQTLYVSLAKEAEELFEKSDESMAQRKADMALVLAQKIHEWAMSGDTDSAVGDGPGLTVQLAEANLRAGRCGRARELFEPLLTETNGANRRTSLNDLRVVLGHAEALYQLGEFEAALPAFNRLATTLPPTDPVRWKSLLRDLQCRTALGQPREGIIKVIDQQRYFYPDLGGPTIAPRFEKLRRENQRRAKG